MGVALPRTPAVYPEKLAWRLREQRDLDLTSTLDDVETFEATSLDQITALLERKRAAQEIELDQLATTVESIDYEELAKSELTGH